MHELQQLAVNGALQKIGKSRFQTTAEGRKLALQKLGLHSLLPETRWLTLKNCYLVATVLKLPAPTKERDRQCIASADGLRASILANIFQLSTDAYPSLTKARDSLLWQQLTDITVTAKLREKLAASNDIYSEPFTTGSIIALLLNNLLGNERELSWKSALKQLVAKSVRARRINPEELRLAILKIATEKPSLAFLAKQFDLEDFAKQVMKSANRCQTGRFGDNQIFILTWSSKSGHSS